MAESEFAELIAKAREGDEAALMQLAEQYEPQIRRVAHRRLGLALRSCLDTMDLVQSVHRSLMLGLKQNKFAITSPKDLVALAVTMITRKVSRQWEKVKREGEFLELQRLIMRRDPCTNDPARATEVADQLQTVLRKLDDLDRRLLQLYLQEHSTVEAARILGQDADVLRVRRSRVFKKLRECGVRIE
jgi:RNA polymerase sigma-70 factor (ECF subfamily)